MGRWRPLSVEGSAWSAWSAWSGRKKRPAGRGDGEIQPSLAHHHLLSGAERLRDFATHLSFLDGPIASTRYLKDQSSLSSSRHRLYFLVVVWDMGLSSPWHASSVAPSRGANQG